MKIKKVSRKGNDQGLCLRHMQLWPTSRTTKPKTIRIKAPTFFVQNSYFTYSIRVSHSLPAAGSDFRLHSRDSLDLDQRVPREPRDLDGGALTDLCIHTGLYAEALDLHAYASALALKYPEVVVVRDVKAEVDCAIRGLVCSLVGVLGERGVKLPGLWKAGSILRRMGVFRHGREGEGGEEELAVPFLSGRGACLEDALDDVRVGLDMEGEGEDGKEGWARYLKKYVDMWREGLHDIITQLSTIFLTPSPSTSFPPSTASSFILSLIPQFTSHILQAHLLPTLHLSLPHIAHDPSALTSILSQLTYCATSFARVGLDFQGVLGPIFEDVVRGSVESALKSATDEFVRVVEMETGLWRTRDENANDNEKGRRLPSEWLISTSPLGFVRLPPSVPPSILNTGTHPPTHPQLLSPAHGLRERDVDDV